MFDVFVYIVRLDTSGAPLAALEESSTTEKVRAHCYQQKNTNLFDKGCGRSTTRNDRRPFGGEGLLARLHPTR